MAAIAFTFTLSSCAPGTGMAEDTYATPPDWAPAYDHAAGARYYYFPDMYSYYDVYTDNFVYWDGFNWSASPRAPFGYSRYDLQNSYIVILDRGARDPWLYHDYYESRYPREYYYGPHSNSRTAPPGTLRGYNENDGRAIAPPVDRSRNATPAPRPATPPNASPRGRMESPSPNNRPGSIRNERTPGIEQPAQAPGNRPGATRAPEPSIQRGTTPQPQPGVSPAPQARPQATPPPQRPAPGNRPGAIRQ